ncbi:MAG: bifunctional (p)ppGpp synthetase/guanosine-3',5'-bis(diphosphate) 3'-pyrophosphohydrolase [Alphaproteobacteria bacterium]|nr:bifunctional (p)ppGpp synthetase/guanosine-3',5'-bis(diphosphate) 3'-pyrophosphohydrolase [Alphaproteobacteria bacterium]
MIRQVELVDRVRAYDPATDEEALNRAYVFSMKAHGTQKRASGDPYFSHPLEVAGILTDLKLDSGSIVTALLHDTVEDTGATIEEIQRLFGPEIARLVDGVTKLSRLELQSDSAKQAENFRKLLLATSEDIRVLLVKLADRLHNMRTLHHIKSADRRVRTARETMEIYAPLAERMGMQEMKDELEDLSFVEIHPDARASIEARLDFLREQGNAIVPRIAGELRATLAAAGIEAEVSGREKRPYSIWRKMQRKNVSFEQLSDIMAFRVIVDTDEACYRALGAVHGAYAFIPGRFKDYVSTPKPNGYQSLHTSVIGPEKRRIEVQIRTAEMHAIAEYGVAAHWTYKAGAGEKEGRQYRWLCELLDILEHASGPEEFLEHTKLEMFRDQVYCFTPKGDLIEMPRGATPVDFAYAVHSEVGDRCVAGKINGKLMPLRTPLQNGDQVEIVTAATGSPSPTWEQFVVSGKARARIRRYVRSAQRVEYASLGEAILLKTFNEHRKPLAPETLASVLARFEAKSVEDLYVDVGSGTLTGVDVLNAVHPGTVPTRERPATGETNIVPFPPADQRLRSAATAIPIRGLTPGMAVHFSNCCHALPGDRIVGILTPGKGVAIHTIDCETLESFHDSPERWLDVSWDIENEPAQGFVGRINLVVANQRGSLGTLSTVIANNLGNINNLKITNRSKEFFEMVLDIEVRDVRHLTDIIAALRATPAVNSVDRARG